MKHWIGGKVVGILIVGGLCLQSAAEGKPTAGSSGLSEEDQHALEVGRKVVRLRAALKTPDSPEAVKAVQSLGLDSRYYVMVRGWVVQHIHMAESYRGTTTYNNSAAYREKVDGQIAAYKKLLRRIDLE